MLYYKTAIYFDIILIILSGKIYSVSQKPEFYHDIFKISDYLYRKKENAGVY